MFKAISTMRSENWGGLASMPGSLIALAAGDAEGFASTACFVASEISFATNGSKSWGYSLGCGGIALGDGLLCFSHATAGNAPLQLTMGLLTGIWTLGAVRYPVERAGHLIRIGSAKLGRGLQKTADIIPPLVGTTALTLRLPALFTAAFGGEHFNAVLFTCNMFWGTADILLGRVQNFAKTAVTLTRQLSEIM